MLPSKNKIPRNIFLEALKGSRVFSSLFLKMRIKNAPNLIKKFSFITPGTVSLKATERNLLRRRGYMIIRNVLKKTVGSFYIVFFFKKGSEKLSFRDLFSAVVLLLRKGGIIKE